MDAGFVIVETQADSAGDVVKFTIEGVEPASRYMLRVRAENAMGAGPYAVHPGDVWTRTAGEFVAVPEFECRTDVLCSADGDLHPISAANAVQPLKASGMCAGFCSA